MTDGSNTSEHKKSSIVIALSVVLPLLALLCDLLVNESIATGTGAVIAGLIASAIASAGYSHSRGRVKSADSFRDAIKKKSD